MKIITALHSALEKYSGSHLSCTKTCDAIVLGSLTKAMKALQALIPLEPPYSTLSFDSLVEHVQAMDIFLDDRCKQNLAYGPEYACPNSLCNGSGQATTKVKENMASVIQEVRRGLCGLDLDKLKGTTHFTRSTLTREVRATVTR